MSFTQEVTIDELSARAIARGLYAVAASDGVHEREAALIASFWADVGGGAAALADLQRAEPISGAELAGSLATAPARDVFLRTALLLAYADGKVSAEERKVIDGYAKALEATDRVAQLEGEVKEFLLSHLTHVQNSAAVAEVAKKLSV